MTIMTYYFIKCSPHQLFELTWRNAFNEEKRRLETKLAQLEEELEDEHNENGQFAEKMRKLQADIEKLTNDLQVEKSNVAKSEVFA